MHGQAAQARRARTGPGPSVDPDGHPARPRLKTNITIKNCSGSRPGARSSTDFRIECSEVELKKPDFEFRTNPKLRVMLKLLSCATVFKKAA